MTDHTRVRDLAAAVSYLVVLQDILEREPSCAETLERVRALRAALHGKADAALAGDHARGIVWLSTRSPLGN
jgi:hypothetical protein